MMQNQRGCELSISQANTLDGLLADRNFAEFARQVSLFKSNGFDVRRYENKIKKDEEQMESPTSPPLKKLTGTALWQYLEKGHGY